jgi:hypothetical protein
MSTMPLSIGETHRFEDGLKLTVSDLTYYDAKPSFLDNPLYGPRCASAWWSTTPAHIESPRSTCRFTSGAEPTASWPTGSTSTSS